ncbi:MAG TPA: YdcF family protein [Rhizomicrobium sp.]|nr:YdcF family protein [Rhizomicrobium sp.]
MFRLIASLIALYLAGFVIFVTNLPKPVSDAPPAEGIVALTGGDERLAAAVQLLESNRGRRLLITGVHRSTTKDQLKRLAHGGARFDCCADLGYEAENTRGNAQEAARWARAHRFKSLIVVTARYHMPRSLTEFEAAMPGVALKPYPVEPQDIDLNGWWRDLRALRVLQGEYLKYLASAAWNAVAGRSPALDRKASDGKPPGASRF